MSKTRQWLPVGSLVLCAIITYNIRTCVVLTLNIWCYIHMISVFNPTAHFVMLTHNHLLHIQFQISWNNCCYNNFSIQVKITPKHYSRLPACFVDVCKYYILFRFQYLINFQLLIVVKKVEEKISNANSNQQSVHIVSDYLLNITAHSSNCVGIYWWLFWRVTKSQNRILNEVQNILYSWKIHNIEDIVTSQESKNSPIHIFTFKYNLLFYCNKKLW